MDKVDKKDNAFRSLKSLNIGCGSDTECTDRIDVCKTNATTIVHNLEEGLPYPDNTFDYVKCKCILEHIKNIGLLSDEIYRVLRPGGRLYLRTDYAGYLPLYIFKSHEHNKALEVQYNQPSENGLKGFGHTGTEDAHYHLFVQSHLDKLFNRFKSKEYNYVSGGRNKIMHIILTILPFNLGKTHIELEAFK